MALDLISGIDDWTDLMLGTQTDFTSLNAVESIFRKGPIDPWARYLSGRMADIFAYSDTIQVPWLTTIRHDSAGCIPGGTQLLNDLEKFDSPQIMAMRVFTDDTLFLESQYLRDAYSRFSNWATANAFSLQTWSSLHKQTWIARQHKERLAGGLLFGLDELSRDPALRRLSDSTDISTDSLLYAFDVVLRYPRYGSFVPKSGYYLNHPVRDCILLPGMERVESEPPIVLSFAKSVEQVAPHMTQLEYVKCLSRIRNCVREFKLNELTRGQTIDAELIREIAASVELPPRLRNLAKASGVGLAVIGGISAVPLLGLPSAVVGSALGVATALWSGTLPRKMARISWLRWAFEWDIESQKDNRR